MWVVHVGDYKMCFATVEVLVNKRTRWKKWTTGKKIFRKKIQCGLQHNIGYSYPFFVTCLTDVFSLVELLLIQLGKARLAPKCPTTVRSEGWGTFHPPLPPPFSLSRDIEWRRVVEDGVNRPRLDESFPEIQSNLFYFSPELKAEIERLKQSHVEGNQQISARALAEVALLREKLKETQHLLAESTRWVSLCAQFFFFSFRRHFFLCVLRESKIRECVWFFSFLILCFFFGRGFVI